MPVLIPPRQPLDLGELNRAPQDPQEDITVPSFQQQQQQQQQQQHQQQHVLHAPLRVPPPQQARIYNVGVTGFGPFQNVPVNPSWACLQPLRENGGLFTTLSDAHRPMRIACFEIPVVYDEVLERIPRLHGLSVQAPAGIDESRGDPSPVEEAAFDAFVHVGVASARHYISIEERARRFGYENKDFLGRHAPLDGTSQLAGFVDRQWSVDEGRGQLEATVSVADVATSITQLGLADVHVSDDPGLYLCEFIYYASLACAKRRAMSTSLPPKPVIFVHIPDVSDRFPLHQLTDIIFAMVSELVDGLAA